MARRYESIGLLSPLDHGFGPEHASMRICSRCYELYEPDVALELPQRCGCNRGSDPRWPGADFNERALLCRCCGLTVLRSGSRWSPFFCEPCKHRVIDLDRRIGRLVIPIGRHSIMNGTMMRQKAPTLAAYRYDVAALASDVAGTINTVISGTDRLWEWYRIQMAQNMVTFGGQEDVLLSDYVATLPTDADALDRLVLAAFMGLASHVGVAVSIGPGN